MKSLKKRALLCITCLLGLYGAHAANEYPSLEQLTSGELSPCGVTQFSFHQDGTGYVRIEKKDREIVRYSFDGKNQEILFSLDNPRVKELTDRYKITRIDGYEISSDGRRLLFYTNSKRVYRHSFTADYYIFDLMRNYLVPLNEKEPQQGAKFSPDGWKVAYVRGNNLYMVNTLFNYAETQITSDGEKNKILNGVADWVYEEEFVLKEAFCWSPDNSHIVFYRFDESQVREFSFDTYLNDTRLGQLYPTPLRMKYPKAGENNSTVSIRSYNIATKITQEMLPEIENKYYIPRIQFAPMTDQLGIFVLNREQNKMDLYFCTPKAGVGRRAFTQTSPTYISESLYSEAVFTQKNIYLLNDKDGYEHIYKYNLNGIFLEQITKGNWDVTQLCGADTISGSVYYEAADETPIERNIYQYNPKKKISVKLNKQKGYNSAEFAPNFTHYLLTYSSGSQVPSTTLCSLDGKSRRVLEDNEALTNRLSSLQILPREFFQFKTTHGIVLNGWMIKPANFNADKRYPVLMVQYSGPGSQEVKNRWSLGFEHYFASQGYLVVCVDGRGTGARGRDFQKATYKQLGILESDDQIEAARYVGTLPYADAKRIAIYGWSYGGTTTLMSLSRSQGVFAAGIAIAPVTDWRYYDTVYTERYLSTPEANSEGYISCSPLSLAPQLNGSLLIVHGTADDNVHFQNTLTYTNALVLAGKQFDMQIYTDRDHSIRTAPFRLHLYRRIERFLRSELSAR